MQLRDKGSEVYCKFFRRAVILGIVVLIGRETFVSSLKSTKSII